MPYITELRHIDVHDLRAADTTHELKDAVVQHAAARGRLRALEPGSPAYAKACQELDELRLIIRELERALDERPWTDI